jgi:hypothetical protein
MPTRKIAAAVVVSAAAALILAGCVQQAPGVIPTSEPSSKPVFASNAAALAAAKKAFTGYVAASNVIGNDGGNQAQRIEPWVTTSRLAVEETAFSKLAASGNKLSGASTFYKFSLQELDQSSGRVSLTAYACDSVAASRVLNSSGVDITPAARQDVIPLEVRFENKSKGSRTLLVEGSDPWSGTNFCS